MQAEREVLRTFGISDDFALAEDLNIYSDGDGDAALFAISVIMLGGLEKDGGSGLPFGLATKNDDGEENSKLAERITDFAEDLEKDGLWKNGRTAANMADWAVEQGLNGKFDTFRTQVVSYIDSFWWKIYGFDACDSTLDGAAWLNDNPYSANRGVYFICKNGKWMARIQYKGKIYSLGSYTRKEDAISARKHAEEWVREDAVQLLASMEDAVQFA